MKNQEIIDSLERIIKEMEKSLIRTTKAKETFEKRLKEEKEKY